MVVERVGLDAGHPEGGRGAAQRDHESIVVDGALGQVHAPGLEVDALYAVATEAEAPAAPDVADRLDDVARLHQRGGHLGQQRGEQQVVLVADQQQLDVGPAAPAGVEPRITSIPPKAAAEDDRYESRDQLHAALAPTTSPITKTLADRRQPRPDAVGGRGSDDTT